ncbi:MlaD family protein [Streptomyces sp. RB6PN25]|uniref:MlaD family protein n=1 Tax=Streptomyces humicola TaxID=2953240 RepID=A0ABT1PNF5_9ACTN|nr:MlaD family protein [Streptomyces humicola]MCQ4079211.1 MlaD family protein [Streptomyces humicola]
MKISQTALPRIRFSVLIAFTALCALIFGYLWVNSGGRLPLISSDGYRVSFDVPTVGNLVDNSDVVIAGVRVGRVVGLDTQGGQAHVTMQLTSQAPLHQGAHVQVREKTLIDETFLQIVDGHGPALPGGTTLPSGSATPAVELNDILSSLDPRTRSALASSARSLGLATNGTRQSISQALDGLGAIGRQGKDTLDALAAQSADLRAMTGNTAALLAALNTRQGEIAELVTDANQLASATANNTSSIKSTMTELPNVIRSANQASSSITALSSALQPVAGNLNAAAPALSQALQQLPPAAAALRALLPTLDSVLAEAPGTLVRVPAVATNADQLMPSLEQDLLQLNPMLSYLQPYGQDIAHLFVNWGASLATGDGNGHALRLLPVINRQAVTGVPANTNIGPLNERNPYPAAGTADDPQPWQGQYPRVQEAPK